MARVREERKLFCLSLRYVLALMLCGRIQVVVGNGLSPSIGSRLFLFRSAIPYRHRKFQTTSFRAPC